ncbi:TIGR00289 family protein [Candidatus Woesearchaeota archaeon]|nr:TIGR00289 family protein [Candidatus Woesearchaeota archaeon]
MNVAVLFSGGKDSVFSCYWALQQGWDVRCLVTLVPTAQDSWMFHTPNIHLTVLQAQAMGIPIITHKTSGKKEEELKDLKDALMQARRHAKVEGLVVGALASDYQHERVNRICEDVGLKTFAPLWHKDQDRLLAEMINCGFEIIVQSIAADGLDVSWLGRRIDKLAIEDLKKLHQKLGLHVAGEGGEYESFVLDGPIFQRRLAIRSAEKIMEDEHTGVLKIFEVDVQEKKKINSLPQKISGKRSHRVFE